MSPGVVSWTPSAPRWYLTSPVPPSGLPTTASIVRSPSNSRSRLSYGWPERVREDAEPPAMRHAHHDLVGARARGDPDRLVEHRHEHVEPLDRELLLPEERAPQVLLERLHLGQAPQQAPFPFSAQRLLIATGLDRLTQPHTLLVVRDVLDLVRAGAAVDLLESRQHVGERLAGHVEAEQVGRDPLLELPRQRRLEPQRLERRISDRW